MNTRSLTDLEEQTEPEQSMTAVLEQILAEKKVKFEGREISGYEAACRKLWEIGMQGDARALLYIFDRIDPGPGARNEFGSRRLPRDRKTRTKRTHTDGGDR